METRVVKVTLVRPVYTNVNGEFSKKRERISYGWVFFLHRILAMIRCQYSLVCKFIKSLLDIHNTFKSDV